MPRWDTYKSGVIRAMWASLECVHFTAIVSRGLQAGPRFARAGDVMLESLAPDHPAWSIVGGYLGQFAVAITLMFSVEKIVFGGGVLSNGALLPHISPATFEYLNGYVQPLATPGRAADYICVPALGTDAGIVGALLMAAESTVRR